jgi:hypothetical protein
MTLILLRGVVVAGGVAATHVDADEGDERTEPRDEREEPLPRDEDERSAATRAGSAA